MEITEQKQEEILLGIEIITKSVEAWTYRLKSALYSIFLGDYADAISSLNSLNTDISQNNVQVYRLYVNAKVLYGADVTKVCDVLECLRINTFDLVKEQKVYIASIRLKLNEIDAVGKAELEKVILGGFSTLPIKEDMGSLDLVEWVIEMIRYNHIFFQCEIENFQKKCEGSGNTTNKKYTNKHHALAYIFSLWAATKQVPISDGGLDAKKLREIGKERTGSTSEWGGDGFYREVKNILEYNLKDKKVLKQISKNWMDIVLDLCDNRGSVFNFLKDNDLID